MYLVCYYCFTLNKRNIVIYKLMNYCVAFINDFLWCIIICITVGDV